MARIKNILLFIAITFSTAMVFAACSGDETVAVMPTLAGQVAGEPTLIYFWNFP